MSLSPVFVELRAATGEFQLKIAEAERSIHNLSRRGATSFDRLAAAGHGAFLAVGALGGAIAGISVRAALKGEQAHALLTQAVKNVGGSMDALEPKIEALQGRFKTLGYTHADLDEGLATLTTALRSPQKALEQIGLSADLARFKHIGLSEAALIVAKAEEGQLRPLRALGIDLPAVAGGALKLQQGQEKLAKAQENYSAKLAQWHSAHGPAAVRAGKALAKSISDLKDAQEHLGTVQLTSTQIQQGLTRALHGQAAAFAQTPAGKWEALKASMENLAEEIGNRLIPKIEALVGWINRHKRLVEILAGLIAGAMVAAMTAWIAKQALLIERMTVLAARTIAVNTQVALFILRSRTAAGAMDVEAASAKGLAGSLGAVAAAAAGAYGAFKVFDTFSKGHASLAGLRKDPTGTPQEQLAQLNAEIAKQMHQSTLSKGAEWIWSKATSISGGSSVDMLRDLIARRDALARSIALNAGPAEANDPHHPFHAATRAGRPVVRARPATDPFAALLAQIQAQAAEVTTKAHKKLKSHKDAALARLRAQFEQEKYLIEIRNLAALNAARKRYEAAEAAAKDTIRRLQVQLKLAQRGSGDLTIVNGAAVNAGYSFAQLAQQRNSAPVTVQVAGSVWGANDLAKVIADALRKQGRQNVSVGIA